MVSVFTPTPSIYNVRCINYQINFPSIQFTYKFTTSGHCSLYLAMTERMAVCTSMLEGEVSRRMADVRWVNVKDDSSVTSDKSSSNAVTSVVEDICLSSESLYWNGHSIDSKITLFGNQLTMLNSEIYDKEKLRFCVFVHKDAFLLWKIFTN